MPVRPAHMCRITHTSLGRGTQLSIVTHSMHACGCVRKHDGFHHRCMRNTNTNASEQAVPAPHTKRSSKACVCAGMPACETVRGRSVVHTSTHIFPSAKD